MKEENRKEEAAKEEQSGAEFGEIGFGKGTGFGAGFGKDFEGFGADNGFGKGGSGFSTDSGLISEKRLKQISEKRTDSAKKIFPVRTKKADSKRSKRSPATPRKRADFRKAIFCSLRETERDKGAGTWAGRNRGTSGETSRGTNR